MRLHARVGGQTQRRDGPVVVLVHGFAVSSRYMIPTASRLATDYWVLAPDLPGSGRSRDVTRVLDIPDLARTLVDWMDVAGVQRAVLLGNSMGCQIVAEAAARYPERATSVVLIGPTIDAYARDLPRQAARLALDVLREPISLWLVQTLDYCLFGPRRSATTAGYMLRHRIEDWLPRVHVPALVVRGERDPIVSQRWAEDTARLLPNGRLAVVRRAAHAVNYNAPEELTRLLVPFLDTCRNDPPG
jgi:pimeloyl-ACP methyl ester carboxylesterase